LKNLLPALAVILFFFSCSKDREPTGEITKFIPKNSSYIISTPHLEVLLTKTDSLLFFRDNDFILNPTLLAQLRSLSKYTGEEPSLLCLSKTEEGVAYTFISKGNPEQITTDSLQNRSIETFTYDTFSIKKFSLEEVTFFTSHRDGILIASNSRKQLEAVMKPDEEKFDNSGFQKVYAAADKRKNSVFIDHSSFDDQFNASFPGSALPLSGLAGWSVMDVDLDGQKILLNGIATWDAGDKVILEAFRNVNPVPNELAQITPTSAAGFYSFTYSNFERLHSNLKKITEKPTTLTENHFLNFTQEAGVIILGSQNVIAFTATDVELARQAITQNSSQINEFRNIQIFKFDDPSPITDLLDPLLYENAHLHFAYLGNFILLAETTSAIEEIITHYLNKTILAEQEFFLDAMSHLASSSSFLMVANSEKIKNQLKETAAEDMLEKVNSLELKNYPVMALQFVQEGDFAHLHGIMNTTRATTSNGVKQIAAFNTKDPIATTPFLLKNHSNNATEIAVQDENNELHLFNASGKLRWKTKLEGRITGKIHQVDGNKNGNLQLAFTTQNALYVLDRAGKALKPFPINFKDDITQPLAVFDYDNNRNYRFVVTQDRDLILYDFKGKKVAGFDFGTTSYSIIQAPQHIRMNNKDYIVVPESGGKLHILSRQGTSRVKVSEEIDFSENRWYSHKGNFISLTSKDEIIRIDESGKIRKEKVAEVVNPYLTATDNIMVLHSENILKINDKTVTLDYGLYTEPEVFNFGNKTFITITDTQAERVFVFNENADLLPGFPVYGSSRADIAPAGKNSFALSVRGDEKGIILYEF